MDMEAEYDTIHMMAVQVGYEAGRETFDSFVKRLLEENNEENAAVDAYVAELVADCNRLSGKIKSITCKNGLCSGGCSDGKKPCDDCVFVKCPVCGESYSIGSLGKA